VNSVPDHWLTFLNLFAVVNLSISTWFNINLNVIAGQTGSRHRKNIYYTFSKELRTGNEFLKLFDSLISTSLFDRAPQNGNSAKVETNRLVKTE